MEVPTTARKRHGRRRVSRVAAGCAALAVMGGLAGCNLNNPGVDPPAGVLSYPIGLVLGKAGENGKPHVLYVVNSNFDLRYNAGSVHAYDLDDIARAVDGKCERVGVPELDLSSLPDSGEESELDGSTSPEASLPDAGALDASTADAGADASAAEAGAGKGDAGLPEAGLPADEVTLPPDYDFASQYGTLRGILCDGRDTDPGAEQCCFDGEVSDDGDRRRTNAHFLVDDDDGEILIDSYASSIAIDPEFGRLYLPVRGRDSLVYIDTTASGALTCGGAKGRCKRGTDASDEDLVREASYPAQPRSLTVGKLSQLLPMSMLSEEQDHTFIVTVHQAGQISLLVDSGTGPVLHSSLPGFAPLATSVTLNTDEHLLYTASGAFGSASIQRYAVAPPENLAAPLNDETGRWRLHPSTSLFLSLAGGYDIRDVLFEVDDPKRIFALMRGVVQSVLFVDRDPTSTQEGKVTAATRVGEGASKLIQATLGGRRLLFVSCFDARAIFVIDEKSRQLISVIRGFGGPFDMVIDDGRKRMYVADFRANVLRVVDLKGLTDSRLPPPRIIATLGKPRFGGSLQ